MSAGSTFLYPNVTSIPSRTGLKSPHRATRNQNEVERGKFDRVLTDAIESPMVERSLDQVREPLKFSAHATQRLRDRHIQLSPELMSKVNSAIDRAEAKGIQDSLVLSDDLALIVSVKNRTVITAMDRESLSGNVFTNIDGAIVI